MKGTISNELSFAIETGTTDYLEDLLECNKHNPAAYNEISLEIAARNANGT